MRALKTLLKSNREWAASVTANDPEFFTRLAREQKPEILWVGCSDSRVPANQIVNLLPGEVFVHRNVANVVVHTDLNCLSVLQYAVDVLKVKHVIVCGHYGCGGVKAAYDNASFGLIDNWLRHVQDVHKRHVGMLAKLPEDERVPRLCELNVIEQVLNICQTTIVQAAWQRGQELAIHGWIYNLGDGLIRDTGMCVMNSEEIPSIYEQAVSLTGTLEEKTELPGE